MHSQKYVHVSENTQHRRPAVTRGLRVASGVQGGNARCGDVTAQRVEIPGKHRVFLPKGWERPVPEAGGDWGGRLVPRVSTAVGASPSLLCNTKDPSAR